MYPRPNITLIQENKAWKPLVELNNITKFHMLRKYEKNFYNGEFGVFILDTVYDPIRNELDEKY